MTRHLPGGRENLLPRDTSKYGWCARRAGNISLQVNVLTQPVRLKSNARGEMQIAILVEQMRREGYESVGFPVRLFSIIENGDLLEPIENLYVDLPAENALWRCCPITGRAQGRDRAHGPSRHARTIKRLFQLAVIGFETALIVELNPRRRFDEPSLSRVRAV